MLSILAKIDLSELSAEQTAGFQAWLEARPHMITQLEVALSQGQLIKAGVVTHRKHWEYCVRLVN